MLAGLSQEELAFRADLSTVYVGMIERGAKNPTIRVLEQLCDGLDIGLSDFFQAARTDRQENALFTKIQMLPPKDQEDLLKIIEQILQFRQQGAITKQ